jgi:electron transfer flavoprotein alpha subunit
MKALPPDEARSGKIIVKGYAPNEAEIGAKVLEIIYQVNEAAVDEAEILVSAGFGAANERGLELAAELAKSFGGAMGATRKLVDAGYVDYEKQVGQTGKTVAPKLCICCGVSGAVQHIAGISSSDFIVAINQDAYAPIFQVADLGIVADLYEFVPRLIAAQKLRRASSGRENDLCSSLDERIYPHTLFST